MDEAINRGLQIPKYIGTKIIQAHPEEKDGRQGYAVVYNADDPRFDTYRSWSPKDVFEDAYRPCSAMNFGLAIEALKKGMRVARRGWNGKGMWLALIPEDRWSTSIGPSYIPGAHRLPWIGMKAVDGGLVPWLASQTDMLSEDWEIVP